MVNIEQDPVLQRILAELDRATPDIIASTIISTGGEIVTSTLDENTDVNLFASVAKAMFTQGNRLSRELGSGTIEQITINCRNGLILARNAGQHALLFVLLSQNPQLGLVVHAARKAADKINKTDVIQAKQPMGLVRLGT